ncbi:hypothetical protein BU17DRAFT_63645 [Hysterangium stoloniferum]|nr:hypothetical protein BU17DRAFT_63645 [Hysterangium stoloniferum]
MEDFAAAEKFKSQSHQAGELRQDPDVLVSEPSLHSEPFPAAFSSAMSFEPEELNDFHRAADILRTIHQGCASSPTQAFLMILFTMMPTPQHLPLVKLYCIMLKGVTGSWVDPGHAKVTFSSLDDYKAGFEAARNWVPEFKKSSVSEVYDGKEYTFDFYYHNPWQWILSLVTDATLAKHLIWYPVKKYLHDDNIVTQLRELVEHSGKGLNNCQIMLWAGFLPEDIRNGSGNGGAVLFLMMPVVEDPYDSKSQTEAQKTAFAFLKQSIYHKVLTTGITIQSKKQHGPVLHGARMAKSKKKREEILQDNGLHIVHNAFWTIANSDPYSAVSYDTLHSDDLGKWGKHLFPKMVEVLGNMKQGGKYSEFMSQIPSWPGLKNVQNVITLDFSDGNTFWDILKTTVPCIVQLFPPKSSFVHCVHALATFQMFAGLHMITSLQLDRMQVALGEYETYCEVNVEKQIVTIDANKEALAYIAMDVETYDNEFKELKALYDDNHEENNTSKELTAPIDNNHWRLGAPQPCLMTSKLSTMFPDNPILHTLTEDISNVVRQYLGPSEIISTGYKIIPYKCVHIHYTSLEDWKVEKDIACCNPSFHGHPQYDCILINTNPVFEEKGRSIIFLKMYYLNDMVDADMFLHCGN